MMGIIRQLINSFVLFIVLASSTYSFSSWADANNPVANSLNWQKFSLESKIEEKISQILKVSVPDHQILVKVLIQAKAKEKNNRRQKFLEALAKNPGQQINIEDDLILRKLDINKFDFTPEEEGASSVASLPDLLEGIKDIDVILFFPKATGKDLRKEIVNLVSQIFDKKFNRNLNIVVVDNPYTNHAKLAKDLLPPTFEQKWKSFLLPAALILAGVLFSLILFLGVGRLKQFSKDLSGALRDVGQNISQSIHPEAENISENKNTVIEDMVIATEATNLQQISFLKFAGIKRFKKMMQTDFDDALIILNRWIKSDRSIESLMVHLLFKSLEDSEVQMLTEKLSDFQLQKIQKDMKVPLKEKDIGMLDKYIELAVLDVLLDAKPKLNFTVRNFVTNLSAADACKLKSQLPIIGGLLFHYLPENVLKELVHIMPEQDFSECLKQSNEFNKEFMMKHGAVIEKFILDQVEGENRQKASGFVNLLPTIMDSVTMNREMSLLQDIHQYCSHDEFDRVLEDILPVGFLMDFEDFPRKVFGFIPMKFRAKMVVSKPEQINWDLEEWVGAKGTKSREVIDIEISDIRQNEKLLAEVSSSSEKIWKEFFQKMRTVIKSNNDIQPHLKKALREWAQKNFHAPGQDSAEAGSEHKLKVA